MRPASFIFNWISNINLLSFTGPFMSSSLPSKLFRRGIKGFACPLHYSSSWITHTHTHNQPDPTKQGWKSCKRFTCCASWLIFCSTRRLLISPHFLLKKKGNIWRWECSDDADCMQNMCFDSETVSCCRFTVQQGDRLLSCDASCECRMFSGWNWKRKGGCKEDVGTETVSKEKWLVPVGCLFFKNIFLKMSFPKSTSSSICAYCWTFSPTN